MSGANLSGADLDGADLREANLQGTNAIRGEINLLFYATQKPLGGWITLTANRTGMLGLPKDNLLV